MEQPLAKGSQWKLLGLAVKTGAVPEEYLMGLVLFS